MSQIIQHLIVIIDNNKIVEPKYYQCPFADKTQKEAISAAKKTYENNHKNFDYESYYFKQQINQS